MSGSKDASGTLCSFLTAMQKGTDDPVYALGQSFFPVLVLLWGQKNMLPVNEATQHEKGEKDRKTAQESNLSAKRATPENGAEEPESEP